MGRVMVRRSGPPALAATITVVLAQLLAGPARADGVPVPGSVQDVFRAGTTTTPSVHVDTYDGAFLTLQAVDIGTTTSEPTIGVAADGTAYFAGATLVVDRPQAWGVAQTHTMRSTDGGLTWKRVQQSVPIVETSVPPGNLDPFVWVDQTTDRVFNIDLLGDCSWLNYSDDRGETWVSNPAACGIPVNDHQTIGGGKPRGGYSTSGYPNILYYCANQLRQTGCGKSLDGGVVWTPTPNQPYPAIGDESGCGRLTGHLDTDPDGRVFLPNAGCKNPWVAISEDSGDTWTRVKVSDLDSVIHEASVASDTAGNLYYVTLAAVKEGDLTRNLPFLSISKDHGRTWGEPIMVAPPGLKYVNFPVIAAGDPGRIAINFPGTTWTTNGGKKAAWNQYVVVSETALDADPIFLSATGNDPADPVHRGTCTGRCDGMWDFIDIVISSTGEAWASAADDCLGACATGTLLAAHAGRGIAIRQIGGPRLRAAG